MERSLKRKVTKVIYYETQPTNKIPKTDMDSEEDNIVGNMQKLRISMRYEYYLGAPPMPEEYYTDSATADVASDINDTNLWRDRSSSMSSIASDATTLSASETESMHSDIDLAVSEDEEYSSNSSWALSDLTEDSSNETESDISDLLEDDETTETEIIEN